jgi:hypothetical protein
MALPAKNIGLTFDSSFVAKHLMPLNLKLQVKLFLKEAKY